MVSGVGGRGGEGRLGFALELQLAPACMRPRASPSARTIQTKPLVVEVFSSLLPQSSLGPVFVSNFACGGPLPPTRSLRGTVPFSVRSPLVSFPTRAAVRLRTTPFSWVAACSFFIFDG